MIALTALGLMSGTSLDGVDVALICTDGVRVRALGPSYCRSYSEAERALLQAALRAAGHLGERSRGSDIVARAEALVTAVHAEAVANYFRRYPWSKERVDVVGIHGQTVVHRPEAQFTLQLGEGGTLARRLGLPVVYDFRAADMAAGGQGAPLVPVYHQALLAGDPVRPPVAVLNIGGVANVTFMGRDEVLLAFDTGPGNAPLDDFMRARTGQAQDWNGQTAATGRADQTVLATALAHPYFASRPPKSLDRNAFTGLELGSL